ncbi:flagellar hook-associated protein 2 [Halomonas shengliensis]|uniref:Flagellar hook-associated protein 2 n=1 Tax=Halomonas shengliensis TaxID=419597 RepID=A0A1H0EW52_9GAMM|nr:flagellar filament capping protein FliD [Halomonas shengliensis]SDN86614.1 flagellar hook-associated protein 2 [Halomonas shengliensis]
MASISSLGIGSGLDLNGLLDQLRDAERGKLEPIAAQQQQQESRISALGSLQSAMTQFDDSVANLQNASLYESLSASGGGETLSTSVDASAQPGNYNVEVNGLATAGTLASQRIVAEPDQALTDAERTLTLEFANAPEGEPTSVDVTVAGGSTLGDIRDAINAKEGVGVTASVINDGEGSRLALMSSETGEAASVTGMTFETDFFVTDPAVTVSDPADAVEGVIDNGGQDAALSINGIAITSATNQVEEAIQGVTLDLQAEGSATLSVEQDTLKVREAVSGFVSSFNELKGTIGELTAYDAETGQAGELNGDRTVRTVESRLRSVLSGGVPGGEIGMLSEVGISLQRDGTLELDEDALSEQVSGNMAALGEFFAGGEATTGMAGRVGEALGQMLDDSGLVSRSIEGAEGRLERLGERYARMEQGVERTIDRYRTQFGQLDGMIAQMNQTSTYLTQQFANLDAQLNQGN